MSQSNFVARRGFIFPWICYTTGRCLLVRKERAGYKSSLLTALEPSVDSNAFTAIDVLCDKARATIDHH